MAEFNRQAASDAKTNCHFLKNITLSPPAARRFSDFCALNLARKRL
jgi:hypothetical protein